MKIKLNKKVLIISIVVVLAVIAILSAIILDKVIFKVNNSESVPQKYKNEWQESVDFEIDECQKIVIPKDEDIKILQLTDIHYDMNNNKKEETLNLVKTVIEKSKPHLIALTGDWSSQRKDTLRYSKEVFDLIDNFDIPWAPVFGNHDMEGDLSRYDYAELFETYKNCLFKVGYTNIGGVGNYIINIMAGSEEEYLGSVFMLDSNTSTRLNIQKYIGLSKGQVDWYKWAVEGLTKHFSSSGSTIKSVMYMHVPLNEYTKTKSENLILGQNDEKCCVPENNSGMFDAILSLGSTKSVFCGHDHMNNAVYDYNGVLLGYGVQSGWCKNYAEESLKGGTLLRINKDFDIQVENVTYKYNL